MPFFKVKMCLFQCDNSTQTNYYTALWNFRKHEILCDFITAYLWLLGGRSLKIQLRCRSVTRLFQSKPAPDLWGTSRSSLETVEAENPNRFPLNQVRIWKKCWTKHAVRFGELLPIKAALRRNWSSRLFTPNIELFVKKNTIKICVSFITSFLPQTFLQISP